MKKVIWLISLFVGLVSGQFSNVEAVSVSPSIVKFSILPGENKSDVFKLHNSSKQEIYVSVDIKDWVLGNNDRKFAEPGSCSRSLSKWITFEEESFTIAPGKEKILRYMAEVPKEAEGGYWGLVCFVSQPLKRESGGGIKISTQVVSFLGIEVKGTLKRKIQITQLSSEYVKDKGIRLKSKLKNLGNVQLFAPSPLGKFKIFKINDKDNNIMAEGSLDGGMILPEETGDYTSDYFKLANGEYEIIVTFDYGEPKLLGKKAIITVDTFHDWQELKPPTK
ncbi:MAG: hypothetical protein QME42_05490 [bacterium]|nr:hypothetical protein [bacterium]